MSKKHFIKGTLILTCAGFLSRFIGFFYRIFLSHTIGAQGLGLFQLIVPLQSLAIAICTSGMQTAITRYSAACTALGQGKKARDTFTTGCLSSVVISLLLALAVYNHASFFSAKILKEPQTLPLIRLLVVSFPLSAFHACINGYYFSLRRTEIPSSLQLLEQLVRVGATYLIFFILSSEGKEITALIAVGGTVASEAAAAFFSLLCIGIHFQRKQHCVFKIEGIEDIFRELAHIFVPLSLNRILLTLLSSMEMFLIPQKLKLWGLNSHDTLRIYGILTGMAMPLILFPGAITNSAATMLIPSISHMEALHQKNQIRKTVQQLFFYCSFLGIFCMIFFFLSGKLLGTFLFHSPAAGLYIQTLSFICPFLYLNTTLTSVMHGIGKTGLCLLNSVISISIRVAFVIWAIPVMGIRGYLHGIFFAELLLTLLYSLALRNYFRP